MMYAKLAWRNTRRSLRDYSIYFLTLVFSVAIFYVFNSIGDQPAYLTLQGSTRNMAQGAVEAIEWLTLFMTGIVALLVIYANRIIIKIRSKELGTYLLLGMEQDQLALLLLVESTVIGAAALLVGLLSGIIFSQFFALIVNRVFIAELTHHSFIFSTSAVMKTILYYGLLFVLVGIWQAILIYRHKLIDLINNSQKNEITRMRNKFLSMLTLIMGLLCISRSYWLSIQVSQDPTFSPQDPRIWMGAFLGMIGTYLLFVALAGALTQIRWLHRRWLSRGLNLFLYRQVTSKINTHALLLATIALMLTLSISAMSAGLGLGQGVGNHAEQAAPFDYMFMSTDPSEDFQGFLHLFNQYDSSTQRKVRFATAVPELQHEDLMIPNDAQRLNGIPGTMEFLVKSHPRILSYSSYRELRRLKDYSETGLQGDQFLIHATAAETVPETLLRQSLQRFLANDPSIQLSEHLLKSASNRIYTEPLGSTLTGSGSLLVVPDHIFADLPAAESYLAIDLTGRIPNELDQAVSDRIEQIEHQQYTRSNEHLLIAVTRTNVVGRAFAIEGMVVFLTFYIGVMFILISATLLALQQVNDAVEHRQRFRILRKLGVDDPTIDKTIAQQLGLYFLAPVTLALIHSLVAMSALDRLLQTSTGFTTVWPATLITFTIFVLIYGTYYLLSLQNCRMLFKESSLG